MERVEEKRELGTPAIISGIAGLLILLGGIGSLAMVSWYSSYWPMMRGMMNSWYPYQQMSWWMSSMGALAIAVGAAVLVGSYMLYRKPDNAKQWGALILIGSLIGLIGMAGFAIGSILGIIGGTMAVSQAK